MPSLAFCGEDPWPAHKRRLMAHMLPVPTRQISHPIAVFVLMKTDDGLIHTRPSMMDLMSLGHRGQRRSYFDAAGVPANTASKRAGSKSMSAPAQALRKRSSTIAASCSLF